MQDEPENNNYKAIAGTPHPSDYYNEPPEASEIEDILHSLGHDYRQIVFERSDGGWEGRGW